MLRYLEKAQRSDGSWEPLWFGNEHAPDGVNPVFGTATVLKHLASMPDARSLRDKGAKFLLGAQQRDGAWSGVARQSPPSIEETAAAVEALALTGAPENALLRGGNALLRLTDMGTRFPAAPIGLYFARLWYHEKLYPLIGATSAFRALQNADSAIVPEREVAH
jgi:squalene-hopene/tetraprenyl-beta-curcumene cyclase